MTHVYLAQEDIKPQFDRSLQKDLTQVCMALIKALRGYRDKTGIKKGPEAFRHTWKHLSNKEKESLTNPIKNIVAKHLGLPIFKITITANKSKQYFAGVLRPLWVYQASAFDHLKNTLKKRGVEKLRDEYARQIQDVLRVNPSHDPHKGKFKLLKDNNVKIVLILGMGWFDDIENGKESLEKITGVLLHELGHIYDIYENIDRKTNYSLLTEHILMDVSQKETDFKTIWDTFHYYYSIKKTLRLKNVFGKEVEKEMDYLADLKDSEITSDNKSLVKEQAQLLIPLLASEVNEYIGKKDDFSRTDSHWRNSERKADRFAVRHGDSEGTTGLFYESFEHLSDLTFFDILYNAFYLKNNYVKSTFFSRMIPPRYSYDDLERRIERALQESYKNARDVLDEDKSIRKEVVQTTENYKKALKELKSFKGVFRSLNSVLGFVRDRWDRAFHNKKDRYRQDTYMENKLQDTIATPLYHEANRLRSS